MTFDHVVTGWDVLFAPVYTLPGIIAAILGFMNRATTQQVKSDLSAQTATVKQDLMIATSKVSAKQDELHEVVNGGLAAAKAEIVSLKAELAAERGSGNK